MTADKRETLGWVRKHAPLWAALFLFLALWIAAIAAQSADGRAWLPEDDAYLRLAVARNLADRGAWELNPGEFAPMFGTILWPLLLAPAFLFFGANEQWPLLLNAVLSVLLIVMAYRIVRRGWKSPWLQGMALAVWVSALPLVPLAAGGMEHVFFFVLLLAFVEFASRRYQGESGRRELVLLAATAMALAAIRYEGLLVIGVVALLFLLRKDILGAACIVLAAALPISVFGWVSWTAGWLPVPASVYLRRAEMIPGSISGLPEILLRSLSVLDARPDLRVATLLALLIPAWLGITGRMKSVRERSFFAAAVAFLAILSCLTLMGSREIRYDGWLILLGGWAALPELGRLIPDSWEELRRKAAVAVSVAILTVLFLFPLLNRSVEEMARFIKEAIASKNQYQVAAAWIKECSPGLIATDSPGAIAFFSEGPVFDMTGFTQLQAFRVRRQGLLTAEWLRETGEGKGISAAILFESGTAKLIQDTWQETGSWISSGEVESSRVYLLAVGPEPAWGACWITFAKTGRYPGVIFNSDLPEPS